MKKQLTILLCLLISLVGNAQVKNNIKKPQTKSQIDNLYEKYKDTKTITLYTPIENLEGDVNIELNDNNKPISISISGETNSEDALNEFLRNAIIMKKKQGYKIKAGSLEALFVAVQQGFPSNRLNPPLYIPKYDEVSSSIFLMTNNNMYFKIEMTNCFNKHEAELNLDNCYSWSIETGDTKRQGGKNATKFEF